jgi:hypothetical protein
MGFTVEKLPGEPIVIYTQISGGNASDEMKLSIAENVRVLDAQTEPVYLINDMRAHKLNLDQILQGASMVARGDNALLHHPMIRENIFVVTDPMMKTAITGLSSATFGQVKMIRFDTVEDALAYCREKIAANDSGMLAAG